MIFNQKIWGFVSSFVEIQKSSKADIEVGFAKQQVPHDKIRRLGDSELVI